MTSLARTLRTTDYFTFAFGTMIGVGWLVVIDDWLARGGPAGAMLGFLLGGIALLPVAWVYGRFVHAIPDAGSEMTWASRVFPEPVGFLAGWLMTLAYLIVCPWEAVAVGKIVAYVVPQVRTHALYTIAGFPVYLPALAIGIGLTLVIVILNLRGIRPSARFQNVATFALLVLFALFSVLGLGRIEAQNYQPLFSRSEVPWGRLASIVLVLQIVPYFLTGFESVPKCSEEAAEGYEPRGFGIAIFWALAVGVLFYVVIIGVVAGLAPWTVLAHERYATAVAFERAFRSGWMVRLIVFAALLSLVKIFNANFVAASRLLFGLGRRGSIPGGTAKIHPRYRTPTAAVWLCGALTLAGALFGDSILVPVTEVGSLCSACGWMVTCAAYAMWRRTAGADTNRQRDAGIAWLGATVAFLFLMLKVIPVVPGSFRRWEYLALGVWLALGIALRMQAAAGAVKTAMPSTPH